MTTQPQDHLSDTYTHKFADGRSVTVPAFKSIMTFGRARKLRKLDEADQMFTLVEDVCSDEALELLDGMDTPQTEEFFAAWQKASGVTSGESSA